MTAKLWETATGCLWQTCVGHCGLVEGVAFAPTGETLVTAGQDRAVGLWTATTGKVREMRRGHSGAVWSVAIAADGGTMVSASADRTVKRLAAGGVSVAARSGRCCPSRSTNRQVFLMKIKKRLESVLLESDPLWYKDAIIDAPVHVRVFSDSDADDIGGLSRTCGAARLSPGREQAKRPSRV